MIVKGKLGKVTRVRKIINVSIFAIGALLTTHASFAAPDNANQMTETVISLSHQQLEEVMVTASRAELPLNRAPKLITIITSADIDRSPAQSIQELLSTQAGIDMLQRGPHGVQADISIRGGSFDQVAILLDGVNLSNPQTGHYSFDIPVNLSDIERIEIVYGPASLVYGASAFAGGINIITKKDSRTNAYMNLEGGMYRSVNTEARGAYTNGSTLHQLSAGYKQSDGYMRNSDFEMKNVLAQSHFDVRNHTLDVQLGYNSKEYGANTFYSAAYPNQFDDTESMFVTLKGETGEKLKFSPQAYWYRHYDTFQLIREGTPDVPAWYTNHNHHRTDVVGTNLNFQFESRFGITSFGGELRKESILSNVLGTPLNKPDGNYTKSDDRTAINYFAEQTFLFKDVTLSVGGLMNRNTALSSDFDFYPAINSSFRITEQVSLYASWNKATRMPTFTDLYYTTRTHIGNSDLESEQSEALEFGLKLSNRVVRADITVFSMQGRNLIDWVKPSEDALWESRNHSQIDKEGVETNINFDLREWLGDTTPLRSLSLGYMYLDQNLVDDVLISNYTLNHLRHKFTANLYHDIVEGLTMSWDFRWQERTGTYVDYSETPSGQLTSYKPFSLLDVKLNYRLRNMNLYASINNVFDEQYLDLGNVLQPGIWVMAGLNYRFQ